MYSPTCSTAEFWKAQRAAELALRNCEMASPGASWSPAGRAHEAACNAAYEAAIDRLHAEAAKLGVLPDSGFVILPDGRKINTHWREMAAVAV